VRVFLEDEGLPRLRISPRYVRFAREPDVDGQTASYLRERMRAALWFLRSVEQRQSTIIRVADAIIKRQRDFLSMAGGSQASRAAGHRRRHRDARVDRKSCGLKQVHCDARGVYALKFFFHSSISHAVEATSPRSW